MAKKRLTLRAAAKALKLQHTTLRKYLQKHPELNHSKKKGSYALDVDELKVHREANVQPKAEPVGTGGDYAAARARRETIQVELAEMDLRRRRGELVERAHAENVIAEGGRLLQQRWRMMNRDLARKLAGIKDVRAIGRVLDTAYAELIERMRKDAAKRFNDN